MKKEILETIRKYKLINNKDNLVIGLSGGPDSMALLYLLIEIQDYIDFTIHIAHINHGVRGEDAISDADFVKRKAEELNLPYYLKEADMVAYGKKRGISSEEAGREIRYGFFNQILARIGGGKIAVAHNKNDQAETLIMRILRGTGIDGLQGMDYISGNIIRPILNIEREDIEDYIERNNIETVLDKTNLQAIYTRNKIRLEVLPYIMENFNPNIIDSLWRLSKTAQVDNKFLEDYSEKKYNIILSSKTEDCIILNREKFLLEDISIQQRVIRRAIAEILKNVQGFGQQHILDTLDLFKAGKTGKNINLPNKVLARVDYENLVIKRKKAIREEDFLYKLQLGLNNLEEIGYKITLRVLPIEEMGKIHRGDNCRIFDNHRIKGVIGLRNRKPGDKFIPFGMKGRKKLKDYFIDEKISKNLRNKIPLLVDDEEIIWVLGYRTNDIYKVNKDTRQVLMVQYEAYNS